ncbi:unnamed protein product, partial [Mesorhabditis spiculigera]
MREISRRALPERIGVAAVPVDVFADNRDDWKHLVRFAFCKQDHILSEAARRLHLLQEQRTHDSADHPDRIRPPLPRVLAGQRRRFVWCTASCWIDLETLSDARARLTPTQVTTFIQTTWQINDDELFGLGSARSPVALSD